MASRKKKYPNPNPWAAHTRGDVWIVCLVIGALFLAGIFAIGYFSEEKHHGCTIEEKNPEDQKMETSCGNFQVSSDLGRSLAEDDGRFEALKIGEEYDIVVAGWDYVNFGIHPNVISSVPSK